MGSRSDEVRVAAVSEPPCQHVEPEPRPSVVAPGMRAITQLQRTVGNAAVSGLLAQRSSPPQVDDGAEPAGGALLQRAPPEKSTADEITDIKKRLAITEKKAAATALDLKWRGKFGSQIADYNTANLRTTSALEAAGSGFAAAQVDQALFEQLGTQLVGGALTIGFAIGFEWMFSRGCGAVGAVATKVNGKVPNILADKPGAPVGSAVKGLSEKVENPANTAAQAGVNITAAKTAQGSTETGQPPAKAPGDGGAPVGSALGFLAANGAILSGHVKSIEDAFVTRGEAIEAAKPEFWDTYDPKTQEAIYQGLLDELKKAGSGATELQDDGKLKLILERHLWATWIKRQTVPDITHGGTIQGLGSFIEDRMNAVGIAPLAGVTMTGHWYSGNSPSNWRQLLIGWANKYAEPITKKSA